MDEERQVSFEAMEHRAREAQRKTRSFFVELFSVALDVLSMRLLTFLSLVVTAFLFGWAMLDNTTPLKLVTASVFALVVFLPVLFFSKERKDDK